MPETLLSPSSILLFGRKVIDLQLVQQAPNPNPPPPNIPTHPQALGSNEFLRRQLADQGLDAAGNPRPAPTLARIYAFSYEGHFYEMPKPAIFLVHGDGELAESVKPALRAARAPADTNKTGVAAQSYSFSEDMRIWSYDKGDFSLRLDVETGPLELIMLEATLSWGTPRDYYTGAKVGITGAKVGLSGAKVGISGAKVGGRTGGWSD
jgi:hypothetical protein